MNARYSYLLVTAAIGLAFTGGFIVGEQAISGKSNITASLIEGTKSIRESDSTYKLISPLLAVGDFPMFRLSGNLENTLSDFINASKAKGLITDASVYYRDLDDGRWAGVDENKKYAPASMYKIVILIAYLKAAEKDPKLLSKEIVFSGQFDPSEENVTDYPKVQTGVSYTVADLLKRMIVYSDNSAKSMLEAAIGIAAEEKVFKDLGLPAPNFSDSGDSMSPKSFSLFFRVLYNASYLSRQTSETALELLSLTEFKDGLEAGVPSNMTVAHKFGYRILSKDEEELHDCGIVYYPDDGYFLCVMTRGKSVPDLESVIKKISEIAYTEVDRVHSKSR